MNQSGTNALQEWDYANDEECQLKLLYKSFKFQHCLFYSVHQSLVSKINYQKVS